MELTERVSAGADDGAPAAVGDGGVATAAAAAAAGDGDGGEDGGGEDGVIEEEGERALVSTPSAIADVAALQLALEAARDEARRLRKWS